MAARLCLLVAFIVTLSACGTTRPAERAEELPRPAPSAIDHSTYETFDASRYAETPPEEESAPAPLEHDVPEALLENRTSAGGSGVVYSGAGYRVQVFQSTNKEEADRKVNEAVAWWRRSASQLQLGSTPEVYTVYRAPYYRVRVGNFQTRDAARSFQATIGPSFAGAFVVQDRVTVRR